MELTNFAAHAPAIFLAVLLMGGALIELNLHRVMRYGIARTARWASGSEWTKADAIRYSNAQVKLNYDTVTTAIATLCLVVWLMNL